MRTGSLRALAAMALAVLAPLHAGAQWWNPMSPIAPGKWEALGKSFVYSRETREQLQHSPGRGAVSS